MVCAVSFTRSGKLYYLDPGAHAPRVGDRVLVPTDAGPEVAECVWAAQWATDVPAGTLPVLAGIASDADLVRDGDARRVRATAKLAARRLARELALPLKIAASTGAPAPHPAVRSPSISRPSSGSTSASWSAIWGPPCAARSS